MSDESYLRFKQSNSLNINCLENVFASRKIKSVELCIVGDITLLLARTNKDSQTIIKETDIDKINILR